MHKNQTIIKVDFTLKVECLEHLPENLDGNVISIEWKRGRKLKGMTSKAICKYGKADINQEIKFTSTLFSKKNDDKELLPKMITFAMRAVCTFPSFPKKKTSAHNIYI